MGHLRSQQSPDSAGPGKTTYFRAMSFLMAAVMPCWIAASCNPPGKSPSGRSDNFETTPDRYPVSPGIIDEASGIADSRALQGYLWTHMDSGYPSDLYLLSHDGKSIRKYPLPGAAYIDWEDIACGPGPVEGRSYLYVGDIGSNTDLNRPTHTVNRVPEITDLNQSFKAGDVERISYRYSDGPRDAETLLLDPLTKDLFIVSKESSRVHLYKLAYPYSTSQVNVAEFVGNIPGIKGEGTSTLITSPTGGDISADGREIIIKNYTTIYYWKRGDHETVEQTLSKPPAKTLPYVLEPEGGGLCFEKDGNGYFTLSEKGMAPSVSLYYYRRKK